MTLSPVRAIILAAVATAAITGSGCSDVRNDNAGGPSPAIAGLVPRATGEVPFERAWEVKLPGRVERSWIGHQIPGLAFFQIADTHEIHCVDATSGRTRWVGQKLSKPILGEPFVQRVVMPGEHEKDVRIEERLYAVVDDTLFCWDVPTGQLVWRYVLPFAPSTGPLVVGFEASLRVYIGDWNDRLQVVNVSLTMGKDGAVERMFPYVIWQWNLDAPILSQGAEIEDRSYFADAKGSIRSFKLDRNQVWSTPTGGAIEGGVTLRDRILYVGNDSNAVHAINNLTGENLGQYNLSAPVRRRPFWFNGEPERLYVWTASPDPRFGGLTALRVQPDNVPFTDGAEKHAVEVVRMGQDWYLPGATELLASTPLNFLVSGNDPGVVWAVHRGTGRVEWVWDVAKGWPNAADGQRGQVDHIVPYQDRNDALRSLIAVDRDGYCAAFRVFDFVPTPEQQAKGINSRALAGQPAPAKTGKGDAAPKPKTKPAQDGEAPAK